MPKVDIEGEISKLEKRIAALNKENNRLGSAHKKKYSEFETLNGALWEGKDVIADSQKQLKKEKDTKKIKKLADEIEAQESTFKKISAKIPAIRKELEKMSSTAKDYVKVGRDELGDIAKLKKDLTRAGGDMKTLKALDKKLDGLNNDVVKIVEAARLIEGAEPPNTPKL